MNLRAVTLIVFVGSGLSSDVLPQVEKKLTATDSAGGDEFGASVSVSGDTVVVGASHDDDTGADSGSVYIFDRDLGGIGNWGERVKRGASDQAGGDQFGGQLHLDVDTLVVGAQFNDDDGADSGSVYIFERNLGGSNNWGERTKINASDGAGGDQFGNSVDIDGDLIIVGANFDGDTATDSGSAYIFERNLGGVDSWGERRKLTASDPEMDDHFGAAVAIESDIVVVGAPDSDDFGFSSGSFYIFERDLGGANNWGQRIKRTQSDPGVGDHFGVFVAISGDTVVVGANLDGSNGSAYIFERDAGGVDNWGQVRKLVPSDSAADDHFGELIGISGDLALISSHWDDDDGDKSGSAYVFRRDFGGSGSWGELVKLTASDAAAGDEYGNWVSIDGDTAVLGAKFNDDDGMSSGAAYILSGSPLPVTIMGFEIE